MNRIAWMKGDFGAFAPYTRAGDDAVFEQAHIHSGERVLDAACGAGVFALRAAQAGAEVVGIDIASNLVEAARERAQANGLPVRFDEGDVEALPYDNASFDTVVSQFGVIFAAHPDAAIAEMARVLKTNGRVVLFCWTSNSWVGRLMQTIGRHVPAPPMPSPLAWGDEAIARSRLASHFASIIANHGSYKMQFPFGPTAALDFFLDNMGPVAMAYASFPEGSQKQALRHDLEQLFQESNRGGPENWETDSDYLQIEGRKRQHGQRS